MTVRKSKTITEGGYQSEAVYTERNTGSESTTVHLQLMILKEQFTQITKYIYSNNLGGLQSLRQVLFIVLFSFILSVSDIFASVLI